LEIDLLFEKIHPALEERFQVWHLQMFVEILSRPPIFVEEEEVGVGVADMEMLFDATGLRAGRIYEPAQHSKQFVSLLRLALEKCDQRASRIHSLSSLSRRADAVITSHAPARPRTVE
jgi:hypothetical protein